jgi:hypothetical protein
MVRIEERGTIPATVDEVWKVVGNYGQISVWLPALTSSGLLGDATGREVGDMRECQIQDGPRISESQIARSDADYTYSYNLVDHPMPLKKYESTVRLRSEGDATVMEWVAEFEPHAGAEDELKEMISGIYATGIESVKKHFGG